MQIKKPVDHPDTRKYNQGLGGGVAQTLRHVAKNSKAKNKDSELQRMRAIAAGEELESAEDSMTRLGLHARWS